MYSSIGHMVFTWLEMFSHVFSRYWSPFFSGSIFHVENSLPAPLIWPVQLNYMRELRWTEQASSHPRLPRRQLARPPVSSAWWPTTADTWKPQWKSVFGQRGGDKERGWKKGVIFSSNMYRDHSLKWEETEEKQSDWWSTVVAFCFK